MPRTTSHDKPRTNTTVDVAEDDWAFLNALSRVALGAKSSRIVDLAMEQYVSDLTLSDYFNETSHNLHLVLQSKYEKWKGGKDSLLSWLVDLSAKTSLDYQQADNYKMIIFAILDVLKSLPSDPDLIKALAPGFIHAVFEAEMSRPEEREARPVDEVSLAAHMERLEETLEKLELPTAISMLDRTGICLYLSKYYTIDTHKSLFDGLVYFQLAKVRRLLGASPYSSDLSKEKNLRIIENTVNSFELINRSAVAKNLTEICAACLDMYLRMDGTHGPNHALKQLYAPSRESVSEKKGVRSLRLFESDQQKLFLLAGRYNCPIRLLAISFVCEKANEIFENLSHTELQELEAALGRKPQPLPMTDLYDVFGQNPNLTIHCEEEIWDKVRSIKSRYTKIIVDEFIQKHLADEKSNLITPDCQEAFLRDLSPVWAPSQKTLLRRVVLNLSPETKRLVRLYASEIQFSITQNLLPKDLNLPEEFTSSILIMSIFRKLIQENT